MLVVITPPATENFTDLFVILINIHTNDKKSKAIELVYFLNLLANF
jgi:hypothetical protein